MKEFKSVQDLIIKAALRDGVSTTIRPTVLADNAVEVVFSKGIDHSAVAIDLEFVDEHMVLHMLRTALFRLFEEPYNKLIKGEEDE